MRGVLRTMSLELDRLDLTDLDLFADGFPYALFAELRRTAPVWWQAPTVHTPGGEGFWVITRHADVERVARDQAVFSSQTGPGATVPAARSSRTCRAGSGRA